MSKTSHTFPSDWEKVNYGRTGEYFKQPSYGSATSYMTGDYNPLHNEAMIDERRRLLARLQNNKNREKTYLHNGWAGIAPKAEPQGSFNMPLSLSGSTRYGYGGFQSLSGGARTNVGQEYVSGLLKQRAQQLDEMKLAQEEGIDSSFSKSADVEPSSIIETTETTLDLLIQNVMNQFFAGEFQDIKKEDINQIYGRFLEDGRRLSTDKLESYYNQFIEARETLEQLIASNDAELRQRFIILLPKNIGLMFFKITVLLRVIISVKNNYTEAQQQKIIRDLSKLILRSKNRSELLKLETDIYNRFGQLKAPELPVMQQAEALDKAKDVSRQVGRRQRIKKESEEVMSINDRATITRLEQQKKTLEQQAETARKNIAPLEFQFNRDDITDTQRRRAQDGINNLNARAEALEASILGINDQIFRIKQRAGDVPPLEDFVYGQGMKQGKRRGRPKKSAV
jgi:hypothetical protein